MAKPQVSREEEVALVLRKIYEVYGADLAKFFDRLAKHRPAEKRPEATHVTGVFLKFGGRPQTR